MIHQLRIYEIFDTNKDAAWKSFMADAEWSAVKRDTSAKDGTMVGAIEDRTLRRTDYSPAA
ncbi:MAG TPA: hypothetical protein VGM22_15615 [Methylomirabilota bacterium]|jgi:hypothetical protein